MPQLDEDSAARLRSVLVPEASVQNLLSTWSHEKPFAACIVGAWGGARRGALVVDARVRITPA